MARRREACTVWFTWWQNSCKESVCLWPILIPKLKQCLSRLSGDCLQCSGPNNTDRMGSIFQSLLLFWFWNMGWGNENDEIEWVVKIFLSSCFPGYYIVWVFRLYIIWQWLQYIGIYVALTVKVTASNRNTISQPQTCSSDKPLKRESKNQSNSNKKNPPKLQKNYIVKRWENPKC